MNATLVSAEAANKSVQTKLHRQVNKSREQVRLLQVENRLSCFLATDESDQLSAGCDYAD